MTIPGELEDAARIDGASHWGIYGRIMLPLSKPALAAFGVIAFLGSWNSFVWPLIVINRPSMKTLPIGLQSLQGFYGDANWAVLMAGAVIAALPMLALFLCAQRFFIEGITLTGLKE
jgi:multiple sugar transport system permease protein